MNGMFRLTQALWQFQRYSSYELTKDENRLKTQQNMSLFLINNGSEWSTSFNKRWRVGLMFRKIMRAKEEKNMN